LIISRNESKADALILVKLAFVSSIRKASGNDASLLEAEIAASSRSGRTDDDVIHQMELQDSAGLENSPGEPQIRFGRGRVSGGMIMDQDEGISGVDNGGLKHFARMSQRLIDTALADGRDLN
jgi:hypothetical protein